MKQSHRELLGCMVLLALAVISGCAGGGMGSNGGSNPPPLPTQMAPPPTPRNPEGPSTTGTDVSTGAQATPPPSGSVPAAQGQLVARGQVRVMFLFQGPNQERNTAVENTLTRVFQSRGYSVIDAGTVAQTVRRHADLLQLYEIEAAKRFGSRLQADIVISGESKMGSSEKTYEILGGKKVTVSQADVTAKAILVNSGRLLAADSAHARKPFDMTGEVVLQMAAEALAEKLLQGIDAFLSRDTID
jgi:hypothetical protein